MMRSNSIFYFTTVLFTLAISFLTLKANTVKWIVPPQYESIEHYCVGVYKYHLGAKVGLMDDKGVILTDECDSITPVGNGGVSLLLKNVGSEEASLIGIFNSRTRNVIGVEHGPLNVKLIYAFFSEDRLPVKDEKGMWGYLAVSGNLSIACQYKKVQPFNDNCAPVQNDKNHSWYINTNGGLAFTIGYNNGLINDATPFFNDGTADVAVEGKIFRRINRKGEVVKKITIDQYRGPAPQKWLSDYYASHAQNDNFHSPNETGSKIWDFFKNEEGEKLKSQLEIIKAFDDIAIAGMGGKKGMLQLLKGTFYLGTPEVTTSGKNSPVVIGLQLFLPEGSLPDDLDFLIDKGDGQLKYAHQGTDFDVVNDNHSIKFKVVTTANNVKSKSITLNIVVENRGLQLFSESVAVPINVNNRKREDPKPGPGPKPYPDKPKPDPGPKPKPDQDPKPIWKGHQDGQAKSKRQK